MSEALTRHEVVSRLRALYDEHHIAPGPHFACIHNDACTRDAGRPLTHGAEAHVGTRYGEVLRIAVVSLDTGGGSATIDRRTEIIESLEGRPLNPHMKGTTSLLKVLLEPEIGDSSPYPFFAMINAAKCAATDGKRDMVPATLYDRCRGYAQSELRLLEPHVVVAQGQRARAVLSPRNGIPYDRVIATVTARLPSIPSPFASWLANLAREYLREVPLADHLVLALLTPHPSARAGQWQRFERLDLLPVAWLARAFVRAA
jgi:uracil-DNA glycosylase